MGFDPNAFDQDAFDPDAFDFGDGSPSEPATVVSRDVVLMRFRADAVVTRMTAAATIVDFTR